MKRYKKLIVAGAIAAAVAGGTGVAMAADGGRAGHGGTGTAEQTVSHRVAHPRGAGSEEKGLTQQRNDDGKAGLSQGGTAPSSGGTGDTYSYQAR
jgi:hypothetical protein